MREQKTITHMTDRELRAYKRMLRRQRERRKKIATCIITVFLIVVCLVSYHSLTSKANGKDQVNFKYYTRVTVQSGDTLWNLADDYIDYSEYKNKKSYINEVCSINRLEDESDIRAGQKIVMPYYSSEFVK